MRKTLCLMATAALVFAACGRQHEAEGVVKEFLKTNLNEASSLKIVSFDDIDSTRRVNDSIIQSMRKATDQSAIYKKGIDYADGERTQTLMILRVKYRLGEEEINDTYYLNNTMTEVVAVKTNYADN